MLLGTELRGHRTAEHGFWNGVLDNPDFYNFMRMTPARYQKALTRRQLSSESINV